MPHFRARLPFAAAAATALALAIAGPAAAHIHPDPASVEAGAPATVGFVIEHGCDGSPTTEVAIEVPEGATDVAGVDVAGFTASVDGQVVTFAGGSLPDGTEQGFQVSFTAPQTPGEVPVKIIQTCEVGSLEWIEEEVEGQPEPEHPAPVLAITAGAPTGAETDQHGEEEATTTTTTEAAATTTTEANSPAVTEPAANDDSTAGGDDDDSNTGLWIGLALGVLVVGGGLAYALTRNRSTTVDDH